MLVFVKFIIFKQLEGADIFIIDYTWMGTSCLSHANLPSLFQRQSKTSRNNDQQISEQVSTNSKEQPLINNNDIHSNDTYFAEEFIPERYLVLLTEKMTEILYRLMISNETSILMSQYDFDRSLTATSNRGSGNLITPGFHSPYYSSPSHIHNAHQSCPKCTRKTLTIEEFHKLKS